LTARLEAAEFELSTASDSIVVAPDKPTEFAVQVQRRSAPGAAVGPITIEAVGLPPGISAPAVISDPAGPTAAKVTLTFASTGTAYNAPIRIVGRAAQPQPLERFARTPVRLGNCLETFWLTGLGKPSVPAAK
jgi:hypothetical protein